MNDIRLTEKKKQTNTICIMLIHLQSGELLHVTVSCADCKENNDSLIVSFPYWILGIY